MVGFLIFLLTPLAWVLVPLCACVRRYPAWLLTPDDPVSPYGQYEPTVRTVYARFGRWVGDVYWLGFRNTWYGLAYALKPAALKTLPDYAAMHVTVDSDDGHTWRTRVRGDGVDITETVRTWRGWALITGYRCSPIANRAADHGPLRHPNMDGRPVFSLRRARNA
jgi:hypothetical protein